MSRRMNVAEYVAKHLSGLLATPTVPESSPSTIIGTHDGNFHCDEAMACGLLRHTSEFGLAHVVRTRAPAQLQLCNVVVDVGAVYIPEKLRFDHHQPEFQDTMQTALHSYRTRLSSAGLVYRHYGKSLVEAYARACVEAGALEQVPTSTELDLLYDKVYKQFVEHIDGIDNGVECFAAVATEGAATLQRNYHVSSTLSARVGSLYPRWNEPSTRADEDNAFLKAVQLATTEFYEAVDFYTCSWLPARSIVAKAFHEASTAVPEGKGSIMILPQGGCPWKEHLFDVEAQSDALGRTIYVLFYDGKSSWRIQAVPKDASSFANRKALPWKGLRDNELSEASGIPGGVFVHASGFIGGNATFEGAKAMALKALEM